MSQALDNMNKIFFTVAAISVALAISKYFAGKWERKTQEHNEEKAVPLKSVAYGKTALGEKSRFILLAAVFVLGFAIRIYQFGLVPGGVNQDEAMAAVDGKALADYATDRFGTFMPAHLYAWGYGQMSSLLSYLIAIFVKIKGFSIITARLPLLLVSIMGGIFFYLFVKDLFGKNVGLAAALFVAINPWHFLQSRWSLDCNLLPHFFIAAMYFFHKGICASSSVKRSNDTVAADQDSFRNGKLFRRIYLCISMLLFGLCMYCYGVTIYTIPLLLLVMAVYYTVKKYLQISDVLICAAAYLFIAWPFLLTMAVNYFGLDTIKLPFVTIQYFPDSIRAGDILFFSDEPLRQLGNNIKSLLNVTVFQKNDLPWNGVEGFGTMYLCTMPFVLAGFVEFARRKSEGVKSLAVFALLTGIGLGLLTNNVNVNRINLIYYGIMIFAVLGIVFTIREIWVFLCTNMAMYAVLTAMLLMTYFGDYADIIKGQFYDGFGDALLRAEASGTQIIYVTADTQYEGSYNVSEILTLFYDATDANYFQGITNSNHGMERLPYNQRFVYADITENLAYGTVNEDASYVIRSEEAGYFDTNMYEVISYGTFSAVVPK